MSGVLGMKKIILDTDIGTDVDDALALALAIKSRKDIELRAVTTVHGDVNLRAKIARKMLKISGLEHIPVAAGISQPLMRDRPVLGWAGYEGRGFLTPEDEGLKPCETHAVDLIISEIMSMKGEITLVSVGPLTNLAAAIIREPRIAENIKEIIVMGGVTRLFNGLNLPYREHNILCDPEAAKIVFSSGAPIIMVPLDVTLKVYIERKDLDKISMVGSPLTDAIVLMVKEYLSIVNRDYTWLHDPLALAVSIDPSLVKMIDMRILVETRGEYTTGQTVALPAKPGETGVRVCVDVDINRFKDFFMSRICEKQS
ncbi:MAG: nucleoside hydrolase [Candidatus Bathyarchaeia archaeon]|nr:nucleoside hydrolase [Candidatus Bathyarchaeota archaeon]